MLSHSSRHACKILLYEYNFEITKNNQESVPVVNKSFPRTKPMLVTDR